MPAYVIVDVTVTDPVVMEEYRKHVPATLAKYGGRFIVRGGAHQAVEGDWKPNRLVLLKFPTYEQARAFYNSELYRAARETRAGATESFNMVVVEGV